MLHARNPDKDKLMKTGGRIYYNMDQVEGTRIDAGLMIRWLVLYRPESGPSNVDEIL